MAAAGPKGRDGPSPREFTAVRHFMMADLGLSGLPLLVYARIFGFCDAGCGYFESKGGLARFLNVQERSAYRAIRDLLEQGLIEECGVHAPARGHATKRYRIVRERLPPGALATPDDSSGFPTRKGDEMTGFAANKDQIGWEENPNEVTDPSTRGAFFPASRRASLLHRFSKS